MEVQQEVRLGGDYARVRGARECGEERGVLRRAIVHADVIVEIAIGCCHAFELSFNRNGAA